MIEGQHIIIPVDIEDEMRSAYTDYSMSVIVSRALPDVRDGLKPVHRRILYSMADLGLYSNRPYKKSARIVGEVLGKYHPHGDASIYDSMVRMAQKWSLRYPLIDGQGNFGSIDNDSPAAMRYTEARLKEISGELLFDIKKNTISLQPNFDESLTEPQILPCKIPNLLINGSSGIAVGMATNMPSHNLEEIITGIIHYIDNPEIDVNELMRYIPGPDFPTGGIIYGSEGIRKAFEIGRGHIIIRALTEFESTKSGREQIIVTELPYQVNKAAMIEKTALLINERKIHGITAIRDESDRKGIRIVYELKKDAISNVVLNTLFKHTDLQISFSINNVALVKRRPRILHLKELIHYYIEHRHEIIVKRTKFDLEEAQKRLHILSGYLEALKYIDKIIKIIRQSKDPESAQKHLIENFQFSQKQTKAILDMRLQRLTNLEKDKIKSERDRAIDQVIHFQKILQEKALRMNILKEELVYIKNKYGDKRRTQIIPDEDNLEIQDILPNKEMVITISNQNYIKRTSLEEYRLQRRGGIGSKGAISKEDDFTEHLFVATNHNFLLIFTKLGKVFWLKVYQIPSREKASKGRPLQNLLQIEQNDKVKAIINIKDIKNESYINSHYLVMCTERGIIKKTILKAYSNPRKTGIRAIKISESDNLLDVKLTDGKNEIMIASKRGNAIRFSESFIRRMGRNTTGVKAITLNGNEDRVVGMICLKNSESSLLTLSEKGYGKRSSIQDYRITHRGRKGVKTIQITKKTGNLVGILNVTEKDEIMIINKSGITIRMSMEKIRVIGRNTQGVKLISLNKNDKIASIAKIEDINP